MSTRWLYSVDITLLPCKRTGEQGSFTLMNCLVTAKADRVILTNPEETITVVFLRQAVETMVAVKTKTLDQYFKEMEQVGC